VGMGDRAVPHGPLSLISRRRSHAQQRTPLVIGADSAGLPFDPNPLSSELPTFRSRNGPILGSVRSEPASKRAPPQAGGTPCEAPFEASNEGASP